MPSDFWQKIGAAASTVVNSLVSVGPMVYKGLVALGTFLVNLAEAIAARVFTSSRLRVLEGPRHTAPWKGGTRPPRADG